MFLYPVELGRQWWRVANLSQHPDVAEDMDRFMIRPGDWKNLEYKICNNLPSTNYVYDCEDDKGKDHDNMVGTLRSIAGHLVVLCDKMPLLWVKGLVEYMPFQCDWNEGKVFYRYADTSCHSYVPINVLNVLLSILTGL